jgi:hypothetical protein
MALTLSDTASQAYFAFFGGDPFYYKKSMADLCFESIISAGPGSLTDKLNLYLTNLGAPPAVGTIADRMNSINTKPHIPETIISDHI